MDTARLASASETPWIATQHNRTHTHTHNIHYIHYIQHIRYIHYILQTYIPYIHIHSHTTNDRHAYAEHKDTFSLEFQE